jgi:hypothetical protein
MLCLLGHSAFADPPAPVEPTPAEPVNIAQMTQGYTYYNRVGADIALHDRTVVECALEASKVTSEDEEMGTRGQGGLAPLMVASLMNPAAHRGVVAAALEDCMVVRGWRVVLLPDAEGVVLAALPQAALSAKLAPWVGSDAPHGTIVRSWGNDAANGATKRYESRPPHNDDQLSLIAATGDALKQFGGVIQSQASNLVDYRPVMKDPLWPVKALKPEEVGHISPEGAVIIVRLTGLGFRNGIGLSFSLAELDKSAPPSVLLHAPQTFSAFVGLLFVKKEGNYVATVVPPGRWRLRSLGMQPVLNLCLGSPSFEVHAGEVVYAGSFDMSAPDIGPDLSLEPVKTWLAGQPAATTLRAATYTNGSKGVCGDNAIYAMEVKGAPFETGYEWGGATPSLVAAAPSPAPLVSQAGAPQSTPTSSMSILSPRADTGPHKD